MTISSDWIAKEQKYYAQTVRRQPVVIVRGEGTRVWDADGKEYLDFVAGWAVNNLGHSHPAVTQAIVEQAGTLLQTSNQFYTVPQLQLAEMLIENSCLDQVFFGNSGAEANEGALKLARRYGKLHRDGAYEVITAFNSFHGRTMATVAATGQPHYQESFTPLLPGFVHVDFDDVEAIMNATTDRTAAVFLEPVQGEGGVNIPADDYLSRVREWCDEKGLLLILDEIQTGMGRLGSLFGYQEYGVEPDVMTLAKGLGYGTPIGAFLSKEYCMALVPGDHGSTFGGNALTTAAAYAGTKFLIENDIPGHARAMGEHLQRRLNELKSRYSFVKDVRGKGLLVAMEFESDIAGQLLTHANAGGLLLNAVKPNAIRFMPPLNVTAEEIDQAMSLLGDALGKI
ncbi:MAG: aspartate aminotransferase family protein [Dehalococcoidia bacterium]|jgi:acetylornithine/N-succinyldiaminopimelate aminotransferase|nr:aspartate aminotransferase family protein [Dehalococcoidia bacterium]MEE2928246.1 aspartate aminotransferase family protein [Chloroflexota bacterium]|tara:strand:- start:411 stop:1601 length:1191 start_codon:yes stop_codon:yes gene_type:complete